MSIFSALNDPLFRALIEPHAQPSKAFAPNFDIQETFAAYIVEGELPGISDKKAVNIEFTDGQTVVIQGRVERSTTNGEDATAKGKEVEKHERGENKVEMKNKAKQPKVWVSERSVGSFRRVFRFPTPVDTDNVKASLEHGILSLVVPKKVIEKRNIEIE
ncbi:HSP20-like chaperone [Trichophaea hybrida]|nr:HSP20-like chaperone [Trichophaea hybrida]